MARYDETREALESAFATLVESGDIDVTPDDTEGIDVIADAWTLHVEGWPGPALAWLAHDDESDRFDDQAIQALLPASVLTALADADRTLGGNLRTALRATDDDLSSALASAME